MKNLFLYSICILTFQICRSQNGSDGQFATLRGAKNQKIDTVLIKEKKIKIAAGLHKISFSRTPHHFVNGDLIFTSEPNKIYSYKYVFTKYYDSIENLCRIGVLLPKIIDESSGKVVSTLLCPIEIPLDSSTGKNYCFYSKNKINDTSLTHLIINDKIGLFDVSIYGYTEDHVHIIIELNSTTKINEIFLKPGYYKFEISTPIKTMFSTNFLAEKNFVGTIEITFKDYRSEQNRTWNEYSVNLPTNLKLVYDNH